LPVWLTSGIVLSGSAALLLPVPGTHAVTGMLSSSLKFGIACELPVPWPKGVEIVLAI
jgi:hypothetical protein